MADTNVDHRCEKRIAVVMYGGVSLAIYIAGVAKELLSVVRATAPAPGRPDRAGLSDRELTPVERIYRAAASTGGVLTTRVIIDVVSGTSAGGINGIFLAKALATGGSLDPVLDLWVEEGDLSMLLNDAESVKGTGLRPDRPPAALLNGRRMYVKLVDAFDAVDRSAPEEPACDAGRIDLFVTTTDIRGEIVRLPVANAVAREKRHRQRFHFTAETAAGAAHGTAEGELGESENPLLAFAARCTSSFPFAFEPFTWNDAIAIEKPRPQSASWTDRLLFVGADYQERPFGDGGYLDNKPFSYAIDELARRQSALEVERTLIYVEPDPEKLLERGGPPAEKPDAVANTLSALTLPGYETIREDLERVVGRNGQIRQLVAMEKRVEEALERHGSAALRPFTEAEWTAIEDLGPLVARYGVGYAAYHEFKMSSVVDSIASLVCAAGHVGRPEVAEVIRDLARMWVLDAYPSFAGQLQLLLDADLEYRLRKFSFVLRRLPGSPDPDLRKARSALKTGVDDLYSLRRAMRQKLGSDVQALRAGPLRDDLLLPIADEKGSDRDASIAQLLAATASAAGELKKYFAGEVREEVRRISKAVSDALDSRSPAMAAVRRTYEAFENFDMVVYPIVAHGEVDEAVEVQITRISPADVKQPRKQPLAGASFGHFGAFLEEQWRHNDILCGRLDAAETLLRQLVKDPAQADAAVAEAHAEIVNEMLKPYLEARILDLPPQAQQQALAVLGDKQKLCALFKSGHGYDLGLDRARQVTSAGRAGIIVEQILRSWALARNVAPPRIFRWGVLLFAMLGQIAIPRTLRRTVAAYWGRLLALLFVLVAVGGAVTNENAVMATGLKGLAALAALGLATLAIASWIGDRRARRGIRVLEWLAVLAAALGLVWAAAVGGSEVAARIGLDTWITRLDRFFAGIALGLLVGAWFQDVWSDLKAVGFRLARKLGLR